jgi:methionyl-tRNA formyltransferase
MRIVFMGTPAFAVPALRALATHAAPGDVLPTGLDVVGVVTRLDKPTGRGQVLVPSPVKVAAMELGVPVYQPGSLRRPEALALLGQLAPALIIVAAFGQILPAQVLDLPVHGCLNVHASLLPRYRGAAPIAGALLAGEVETGVTLMRMDVGLDTGPIVAARRIPILPAETAGELTSRLADVGATLLVQTLPAWLTGGIVPVAQDPTQATMTQLLRKEDGRLDWTRPAAGLARRVRAFTPWPGAFTLWNGRQLKVLRAAPLTWPLEAPQSVPGTVHLDASAGGPARLVCACGEGALALEVLQLEGKRALPAAEFVRGYARIDGARLGDPSPAT